ncbi:MAG: L-histidine N(alpha)-methyltransferase [Candidatus Syntrophonatronum acetioxidans]|uniref:L-histidine N(Alpha)-methyltransferase n=1 Tax=Candidatus Syntrophonatronum acetioxidans TaxID=1795816 RepID=A0A424YBU2_9FIRM|nr:MAG: L-histidine N(alpha)-methyltransferase [Candidatus Syntrophonatronum acetioxidans]
MKIDNLLPEIGKKEVIKKILAGLTCENKYISSMFFYDEVGSKLFEKITRLPEYYIPRIEKSLIRNAATYLNDCGWLQNVNIVEYGCGDCSKISILFESISTKNLKTISYTPVDVSHSAILESANILLNEFCGLRINIVLADFVKQVGLIPGAGRRIFCLFGSTLGNLTREQALQFCRNLARTMGPDNYFLLGLDMVKTRDILFKAYNDSLNVTSEFNRNILNVVNKLTGTDFDPRSFEHLAFFNEEKARIEMHLRAKKDIDTYSPYSSKKITIKKGETIHTENSHKFTNEHIKELANTAGFEIQEIFTDEHNWFSLVLFTRNNQELPHHV